MRGISPFFPIMSFESVYIEDFLRVFVVAIIVCHHTLWSHLPEQLF